MTRRCVRTSRLRECKNRLGNATSLHTANASVDAIFYTIFTVKNAILCVIYNSIPPSTAALLLIRVRIPALNLRRAQHRPLSLVLPYNILHRPNIMLRFPIIVHNVSTISPTSLLPPNAKRPSTSQNHLHQLHEPSQGPHIPQIIQPRPPRPLLSPLNDLNSLNIRAINLIPHLDAHPS